MSMFGTRPHNPPSGVLPTRLEDLILPRPQRISLDGKVLQLTHAGIPRADLICDEAASGYEATAIAWLRHELKQSHGWNPASSRAAGPHVVLGIPKPGSVVQGWIKRVGMVPPSQHESYALRISEDHVILAATEGEGLLRGVTTLVQLLSKDREGELCLPCGEVEDWPSLPLRLLIGWVRSDRHPKEIINFAFRYKFNRIFYGLWNWTSGESLGEEDQRMVEYSRKHGIELMFQLSRLSFPKDFDATKDDQVSRIVNLYEKAIETGFRSFGILFDDQTYQSVEAEMNLTLAIYRRLEERLGGNFEFTFCPEVYWVPGELAGWPPQPERAEEFRLKHIEYLEKMGAALPEGVEIYIANNWNDYPEGYSEVQEKEFNARARRKPNFFENQLVNDYRRAIILPFPVHNRPQEFATAMKGYGLNMPMPYSAYYPSMISCGALAWNPAGYNPPLAWGAAVQHCFGNERTPLVLEGLNSLNRLFVDWTQPHFPAANHYASLSAKLKDGTLSANAIVSWRKDLARLKSVFAEALRKPGTGAEALQYYIEEMERLDLDMALFTDMIETRTQMLQLPVEQRETAMIPYRDRQAGRYRQLLRIQAHRAPPLKELQVFLSQQDETRRFPANEASEIPGGWWVSYCYGTMKEEIENSLRVGEEFVASKGMTPTDVKS